MQACWLKMDAGISDLANASDQVLASVFELISAYDLAFLYLTGHAKLQRRICNLTTQFQLRYNPYRRVSWPGNFLRRLSALRHVHIGGFTDHTFPYVANVNIRDLSPTLTSLELCISNGFLALLELPDKPSLATDPVLRYRARDLRDSFPHLEHLRWESTTTSEGVQLEVVGLFEHLSTPRLHSLDITALQFHFDDFAKLPHTLERLAIDTLVWIGLPSQQYALPPRLVSFELLHLTMPLSHPISGWPPTLKRLSLGFEWIAYNESITNMWDTVMPPHLTSLVLYAPFQALGSKFFQSLPDDMQELRIYASSIIWSEFNEIELADSFSTGELRIFHFCIALPGSTPEMSLSGLFAKKMPPKLVDFTVTAGLGPMDLKKAKKSMPKHLACLRTRPLPTPGTHPNTSPFSFPTHIENEAAQLGSEYPKSLLDLEDCLSNLRAFPPTLTRLSLQNYFQWTMDREFDYTSIGRLLPNVTDLSLQIDSSFEILRFCTKIPLQSLTLDVSLGSLVSPGAINQLGIDPEAAMSFDFGCFKNLDCLTIHPLFISNTSRQVDWFERLPATLRSLSFVPNHLVWKGVDNPVFPHAMPSWQLFPLLPRALTRFTSFVTDLHVYSVFSLLPDSLTELYLLGNGGFKHFDIGPFQAPRFGPRQCLIEDMQGLPLSLTNLVLPAKTGPEEWEGRHEFFLSRPQLANFSYFRDSLVDDGVFLPFGYAVPPSDAYVREVTRDMWSISHDLRLSLGHHQALSANEDELGTFRCNDTAMRRPVTMRTLEEIEVMKSSKLAELRRKDLLYEAHAWVDKKLAAVRKPYIAGKVDKPAKDKSSKSSCNPS